MALARYELINTARPMTSLDGFGNNRNAGAAGAAASRSVVIVLAGVTISASERSINAARASRMPDEAMMPAGFAAGTVVSRRRGYAGAALFFQTGEIAPRGDRRTIAMGANVLNRNDLLLLQQVQDDDVALGRKHTTASERK